VRNHIAKVHRHLASRQASPQALGVLLFSHMKRKQLLLFFFLGLVIKIFSQPCAVAQSLSLSQLTQIGTIVSPLDSALKYENLFKIDSLSTELKNAYGVQGGRPDGIESYYALVSNINWVTLSNAITLSRSLIATDSLVYVNLWKTAKGMNPPTYQPHSLFLRASAEIAIGLLKIADKETDMSRKSIYQLWATRTLDSLATMQIQTGPCAGAFPFPDLRPYNDPTFGPIIQNFMFSCGADSVNVLQNGWIIDDKGKGEFKFDAGVIANAYYEAYNYTGNLNYKNIAIAIGNYLKPLKFNRNYNYNTFVSLGLTRAYQLNSDQTLLDRAIKNIRYSVLPGQISNGRWVDGHNANSRYHSIIVQNIAPTIPLVPNLNSYKGAVDTMIYKAVKNFVDYAYTCNSATGYRWLIKAYMLNSTIIPQTLKDSVRDLIGTHINQSVINGKYLDIPTMGDYLELLSLINGIDEIDFPMDLNLNVFPNPNSGLFTINASSESSIIITDIMGKLIYEERLKMGTNHIDLYWIPEGLYFLKMVDDKSNRVIKFIKE